MINAAPPLTRPMIGWQVCSILVKKGFVMLHISRILAIAAGLILSACAPTGPGSASTKTASAAALQAGEWRVEDIAGAGVIDNSHATLLFGAEGNLSGSASCNRLIATYTVEGNKLKISPAGTTMMACPPALMNQERKLIDLLGTVTHFSIDQTGTLTLESASGEKIVARR